MHNENVFHGEVNPEEAVADIRPAPEADRMCGRGIAAESLATFDEIHEQYHEWIFRLALRYFNSAECRQGFRKRSARETLPLVPKSPMRPSGAQPGCNDLGEIFDMQQSWQQGVANR